MIAALNGEIRFRKGRERKEGELTKEGWDETRRQKERGKEGSGREDVWRSFRFLINHLGLTTGL